MKHTVTVNHTFEAAHRLPQLGGKCANLHGHSWKAAWSFTGTVNEYGVIVDFTHFKTALRGWVDDHLDHAAMLGDDDTVLSALTDAGSRVYVFGHHPYSQGLSWPTVENVATMLHRMATEVTGLAPTVVTVNETATNIVQVTR